MMTSAILLSYGVIQHWVCQVYCQQYVRGASVLRMHWALVCLNHRRGWDFFLALLNGCGRRNYRYLPLQHGGVVNSPHLSTLTRISTSLSSREPIPIRRLVLSSAIN